MEMTLKPAVLALCLSGLSTTIAAGEADVLEVRASVESGDRFNFEVTLKHADSGWEHYADAWEVLTVDGELLGRRVLYHPHVHEQPFTRGLSAVTIPPSIKTVRVRARDSVHGVGGREQRVQLPGR